MAVRLESLTYGGKNLIMFDADQTAAAILNVLARRNVRANRQQIQVEMIGRTPRCGLRLSEEFAPLPTEREWSQWFGDDPAPPPMPVHAFTIWGYEQPVMMSSDEVPRLHYVVQLIAESGQELRAKAFGVGEQTLDGLEAAIGDAYRFLSIPIRSKTIWLDRP